MLERGWNLGAQDAVRAASRGEGLRAEEGIQRAVQPLGLRLDAPVERVEDHDPPLRSLCGERDPQPRSSHASLQLGVPVAHPVRPVRHPTAAHLRRPERPDPRAPRALLRPRLPGRPAHLRSRQRLCVVAPSFASLPHHHPVRDVHAQRDVEVSPGQRHGLPRGHARDSVHGKRPVRHGALVVGDDVAELERLDG